MKLIFPALALMAALLSANDVSAKDQPKMKVWKHPQCGCCGKWIEHMREAGFSVEVNNERNMSVIKRKVGIPESLESCHTAVVDGYRIEGHVPAHIVKRLLKTRPKVDGIAVPCMTWGSPGMDVESEEVEPYEVRAFQTDGSTTLFSRHP